MMCRVYELGPQHTKMATTLGLDTLWSRYLGHHELIGTTHKKNMPPYQKKDRGKSCAEFMSWDLKTQKWAQL